MEQIVEVRNTSDKPFTLKHDTEGDVTIKPMSRRFVTIRQIVATCGNPAARNQGKNQLRAGEFKSIRIKAGFYPGVHPADAWFKTTPMAHKVDANGEPVMVGPFCPPLEVYDLEGNRVFMVHDDPEGKKGLIVPDGPQDESKLLDRIAQMERMLQQLLNEKAEMVPQSLPNPADLEQVVSALKQDDTPIPSDETPVAAVDSDVLPEASESEPAITQDTPRTTRTGSKVKTKK